LDVIAKAIGKSVQPITSLTQLIETLKTTPSGQFESVAQHLSLTKTDVLPYATFSSSSHTRNCLELNERFELILLCWEPGQMTGIHDHGGEECWVYFMDSQFEEIIYERDQSNVKRSLSKMATSGAVSYMSDFLGVHSLKNIGNSRGFSLHLYAKPIRSCNVFNHVSEVFEEKEMHYDTRFKIS
jgi:cysteine dioxygenase